MLDTSGYVEPDYAEPGHPGPRYWDDLSTFTQGYIEALFADLDTTRALLKRMGWDYSPAHDGYINPNHLKRDDFGGFPGSWDQYPSDVDAEEVFEIEGVTEFDARARHPARFADLAPETLAKIMADCERFPANQRAYGSAVGGAFWKNRQAKLQRGFPPLTIQLGDDGKVRFA